MKIIVGLGNPGQQYIGTRHNTGRAVLEQFVATLGASFKLQPKFSAEIASLTLGDEKVIVTLPASYYNESGRAVRALCDFYRITPSDVLIVHDELALPLGSIRTRIGGSSAGNNGVKSVTEHLGEATARLRIGVATDLRDQTDDTDFVLGKFNSSERAILDNLQHVIEVCIEDFIYGQFSTTTHHE